MAIVIGCVALAKYTSVCKTGGAGRVSIKTRATASRHAIKDLNKWPPSKSEQIVRVEIEKLTGDKFPTVYPTWLNGMELDGYCERLKLAFEFQGPQHTKYEKRYDSNYMSYYERLVKDAQKIKLCHENGVYLIVIDYITPRWLLNSYLRSRLYDYCQWPNSKCELFPMSTFKHRPEPYIDPIEHKIYRDEDIERQLKITI